MGNEVENASLGGMKKAYLNALESLNTARTEYETSGKKSEKLHEKISCYEKEFKKYEEKLRMYGINPESILCKKSGSMTKPVGKDTERLLTAYPI